MSANLNDARLIMYVTGGAADYVPRLDTNLQPSTRYYWQAVDACGEVLGPLSAKWTFNTPAMGVVLPAPALTAPISGTLVSASTAVLQWTPVAGAVEYKAMVRQVGTNSWRVYHAAQTTANAPDLRGDTTYEWKALARNDYAWGAEPANWRFATGPFTSEAALPAGGDLVREEGTDQGALVLFDAARR